MIPVMTTERRFCNIYLCRSLKHIESLKSEYNTKDEKLIEEGNRESFSSPTKPVPLKGDYENGVFCFIWDFWLSLSPHKSLGRLKTWVQTVKIVFCVL